MSKSITSFELSSIFNGVKITPRTLVFKNAYEGKSFRGKITFQNVSKKPTIIRTVFPKSSSFKLENNLYDVKLSCGIESSVWVNYTYSYSAAMMSCLELYVNQERTQVEIQVTVSKGEIFCNPANVNFGKINLGYAVHVETVQLFNKGHKQTKFEFDVSHKNLGLSIIPRKGFIPACDSIEVEIDLIAVEEGTFMKEIWIKCDHPFRLTIFVEVIKPTLYICSPNDYTESFLPIMIPPIYGGCRSVQNFAMFNLNMLDTTFVIVPEYDFKIRTQHNAQQLDPNFKYFSFSPNDGHMAPNDRQAIEIRLEAQTVVNTMLKEQLKQKNKEKKEYLSLDKKASMTSLRMYDTVSNFSVTSLVSENYSMKQTFGDYIRICVSALVKSLKVEVDPVSFTLDKMLIHTESERNLVITNKSRTLPIFYEYEKVGYIKIEPPKGFIKVSGSVKVKVIFAPKAAGTLENPIKINFLSYSQAPNQEKKVLNNIGSVDIPVYIPIENVTKHVEPKFNMGITPHNNNAVGFMTNDVRFNTKVKKPRMAVQQCYAAIASKKKDNALIAFPNDRPGALQPTSVKCKTIFAGLPRLLAPLDEYMLNEKESLRKLQNDEYYLKYIRNLQEKRRDKKHVEHVEDYLTNDKKLFQNIKSLTCPEYRKDSFRAFNREFCKLKPIEMYFVSVTPSKINIGQVVVYSKQTYQIKIFNENSFPVHITVTSFLSHKNVLLNLPEQFVVLANETKFLTKEFCPNACGNFNSIINVYINSIHLIPILIQAEVIVPYITIDVGEVVFSEKDPSFSRIIPLKNTLNITLSFYWTVPIDCCYTIQPMNGKIPPKRVLCCEMTYTPSFDKRNCIKLSVHCEDGASANIYVNAYFTKFNVELLEHKIEMFNIPLNILTERKTILRNQEYESVLFKIKNTTPCYGVEVVPKTGCIRGRSDFQILIKFLFDGIVKFNFKIYIDFENGFQEHFIVFGSVDIPTICCKPKDVIKVRRIPAQSYEIIPFSIGNMGNSKVNLQFPVSIYPELTVSSSPKVDCGQLNKLEITLEEGETAHLFIHFYPLDVSMNDVYLPLVINNILGPADKLDINSLFIKTYIKDIVKEQSTLSMSVTEDSHLERIKYEKKQISVLNISTVSTKHILQFTKTDFKFKYFPNKKIGRNVTSIEFKVKNYSTEAQEFCFDISNMSSCFTITCKRNDISMFEDSEVMDIVIPSKEKIIFVIQYTPEDRGEFTCLVPIYIKHIKDDGVFNHLKLKAVYPPPTFEMPRWVFLEPVPLKTTMINDIKLTLLHHSEDCSLNIICESEELKFQIFTLNADKDLAFRREVCLRICFQSNTSVSNCQKVAINCTCGADTFIIVGFCASDEIITTYTHHCPTLKLDPVIKSRGYPYFPQDSDNSDYANYMRRCVTVVEKWIYEQVLNLSYYYFMPGDMSGFYRNPIQSKNGTQRELVIFEILQHFYCEKLACPVELDSSDDELSRVNYLHCNLKLMLINFSNKEGAFIPQIRSRYLLTYNDYILYMTQVRPKKGKAKQPVKTEEMYMRRSKQCWLDLMLNIFNVLVLPRIVMKKMRSNRYSLSRLDSNISQFYITLSPEQSLLAWLDFIYEQEQDTVMKLDSTLPENYEPKKKSISNFTTDLSDGIILIGLTIHFCPYLIPYLQDNIYFEVDTPEKAFHNAVQIVEVWKLINCSFKITPSEIAKPIAIQMVFLIMYMYDVFGSLLPKEEIYFSVGLSSYDTKQILIKNSNNLSLHYEVKFINDDINCFRLVSQQNFIRISAGKTYKLNIEFRAKTLAVQKATLLLCGDTPGQKFCKSIVYSLNGQSNFTGEHERLVFEVDLYKSVDVEFTIKSPYAQPATYNILCTKCSPSEVNVEKLIPIEDYLSCIRPRMIFTRTLKLVTDETGEGVLGAKICCLTTNDVEATIVYTNSQVGDFFICIVIRPTNFDLIEKCVLDVELPEGWDRLKCNCCANNNLNNPIRCPKRVVLKIPCRNDQFWNIITTATVQCVPEKEKDVWAKYIENEMGPYLLKWIYQMSGLQEIQTIQHILDHNVPYLINNKHTSIILPENIIVTNVRSMGTFDMEMHVKEDVTNLTDIDFSLQSADGTEFRWYILKFIFPESSDNEISFYPCDNITRTSQYSIM